MTAELIEIAEVILVRRILRVSITGCSISPVTTLGLVILRQMNVDVIFVVLELKRFVLCPRRNLKQKSRTTVILSIQLFRNPLDLRTLRTLCCRPCLSLETKICSARGCLPRLLPSTSANVPPTLYLAASR